MIPILMFPDVVHIIDVKILCWHVTSCQLLITANNM